MILDTSAVVAIALGEPESERLLQAILGAASRRMSSLNWLEGLIVAEGRKGPAGARDMEAALASLGVEAVAFDHELMRVAHAAWLRLGKGRHPAALNIADCCAYATAAALNEPLLFQGTDFALTDVEVAGW